MGLEAMGGSWMGAPGTGWFKIVLEKLQKEAELQPELPILSTKA